MTAEEKAAEAMYERIAELSAKATTERLGKLADAYAKVKYGAQGRTVYDYIGEEPKGAMGFK